MRTEDVKETPAAPADACPRCGQARGPLALLCRDCWSQAPAALRQRWNKALVRLRQKHPAAQAIFAWAKPAAEGDASALASAAAVGENGGAA